MKRSEINRNELSPMMLQYMGIKDKHEDSIIFFRLGDFYEMFFEDAIIASRELELTLTGKQAGLQERIPMCGIPHHSCSGYIEKLIEKGYKVAICEQLSDPKDKKVVERDVVQIITKGTKFDNLNEKENNYIGNIYDFEYVYIISFTDITTGSFYTISLEHDNDKLINEILNRDLKEIIVNSKIDRSIVNHLREKYNLLITIDDSLYNEDNYDFLYNHIEDVRVITSVKHLLFYLLNTKKGDLSHLQQIQIIKRDDYLLFDVHTKNNLELTETVRLRDKTYSLLWLLDKTKTAMGSRLLKESIENPLTNLNEITRRYQIIETFLNQFIIKDELKELLDEVYDLERLIGRVSYGNLNGRDLIQLKNSIKVLPDINKLLTEINYDKNIETLENIYQLLDDSINENPPVTIKEGYLIKDGYDKELDELRLIRTNSKDFLTNMEKEERERTGIKNLKVGYNKVFGYFIEVSKGNINQVKDEFGYDRKQTLSNCERFITPLLKEKEDIILHAEERIINLEYKLFMKIRDEIKMYVGIIQLISKTLSEVDMLLSLATISEINHFVKPNITNDNIIKIIDGRHPIVEAVSKKEYIPNDIIMDKNTNVLLITGPNMAGKSTYMRQLAITIIMAQIGCYVPAKSCTLPIFDKIFTRIGASDDLVSGESTFMVEMKEANLAIKEATKNSLILFDELGRGTATYDGMSLAQAILEYIHDKIEAKTLFSTHYHELTSLSFSLKNLKNVHVSAVENDGELTFLHKVKPGAVDKSYGIHVASLAHMPKELIERAKEILNMYEDKSKNNKTFVQTTLFNKEEEKEKIKENIIESKIRKLKPLELTPLEALNILYELNKELNSK